MAKLLSSELTDVANRARLWVLDLQRHARQEAIQGNLSPTDQALLKRLETFLLEEVAPVGDRAAKLLKSANR